MRRRIGVRRADEDDVAELVRLRALPLETLGGDFINPPRAGDGRRAALAAVLRAKLTDHDARFLVVDGDDGFAACGIGTVDQWFPGFGERRAARVDPHASREGESLYREPGFFDHPDPSLCRRP